MMYEYKYLDSENAVEIFSVERDGSRELCAMLRENNRWILEFDCSMLPPRYLECVFRSARELWNAHN